MFRPQPQRETLGSIIGGAIVRIVLFFFFVGLALFIFSATT